MTKFAGYKTIAFAILTMLGGAVQASTGILTPDQMATATSIIGALFLALRLVTVSPPLQKPPSPPPANPGVPPSLPPIIGAGPGA